MFFTVNIPISSKKNRVQISGRQNIIILTSSKIRYRSSLVARWYRTYLQCRRPGSIFGQRRSPGEENGYLLQYSCLENSMDRRVWRAIQPMGSQESDTTEGLTHDKIYERSFCVLVFCFAFCCLSVREYVTNIKNTCGYIH